MSRITGFLGRSRRLVIEPHATSLLAAAGQTQAEMLAYCEAIAHEDGDWDPADECFVPYTLGPDAWVGVFVWPKKIVIRAEADVQTDDSLDEPDVC